MNVDWFELPGEGKSGSHCGDWLPGGVCTSCGEPVPVQNWCGRRTCSECWTQWAEKAAVRATHRIQMFRHTQPDDYRRQAAHAVVSPPEGEIKTVEEYWSGKGKAADIAKEKGWRGFAVIPHPFRVTEEGKQRYREADPDVGVWVWLRNEVEELREWVYWSPHYHIIGMTDEDMDSGDDSDEWVYHFVRSVKRYGGVSGLDSHEDLYGLFRYLLSHTGYPEESSKQLVSWYGCLANSVFVERPIHPEKEHWQYAKPRERIQGMILDKIEKVVGAGVVLDEEEDGSGGGDEDEGLACRNADCEHCGESDYVVEVGEIDDYLQQKDPPRELALIMRDVKRWRIGTEWEPPPGLKHPKSHEEMMEVFDYMADRGESGEGGDGLATV
jgi:hypothetical protein